MIIARKFLLLLLNVIGLSSWNLYLNVESQGDGIVLEDRGLVFRRHAAGVFAVWSSVHQVVA